MDISEYLLYWHDSLKDHPDVVWVIVFKDGAEGYKTKQDAMGDYDYQTSIRGPGTIMRVGQKMVAVAAAKKQYSSEHADKMKAAQNAYLFGPKTRRWCV